MLRADAACWDLGYPSSVQRPDGKIVTVYYHNDHKDGERNIAATIWDPGRGTDKRRPQSGTGCLLGWSSA